MKCLECDWQAVKKNSQKTNRYLIPGAEASNFSNFSETDICPDVDYTPGFTVTGG